MLERRRLLQLSAGTMLTSIAGPIGIRSAAAQDTLVARALAAGQDRVVMGASSGAYMDRLFGHILSPFTEETGIRVDVVSASMAERAARLRAMNATNNIEWDLVNLDINLALNPDVSQDLLDLADCSQLPNLVANGLDGACGRYGVRFDIGGMVVAYDPRVFPDGGPQSWADFWDVERFPGPRSLPNYGSPWTVLMAALMADGVEPDQLFPLDLDRAFIKLDELRPHVTVWWSSGDQNMQIFRSQEVVMGMLFSNRASKLQFEEGAARFTWNQGILGGALYCILHDAPRPLAAMALLDSLYARPEAQAAYMTAQHVATFVRGGAELLDPAVRATLVTTPENWERVVQPDPAWLTENRDDVVQRWTTWISG